MEVDIDVDADTEATFRYIYIYIEIEVTHVSLMSGVYMHHAFWSVAANNIRCCGCSYVAVHASGPNTRKPCAVDLLPARID